MLARLGSMRLNVSKVGSDDSLGKIAHGLYPEGVNAKTIQSKRNFKTYSSVSTNPFLNASFLAAYGIMGRLTLIDSLVSTPPFVAIWRSRQS